MRCRDLLAIALLVLAAGGCTTDIDDSVVVAVSTMVPSLADSDLTSQVVEAGGSLEGGTIQNVYFKNVTILDMAYDEFQSDMTFGEDCEFFQAWNTPVFTVGKCASGVIVDGDEQQREISLEVLIGEITVQRVPPLPLDPLDDYDADGVDNADDNCLLIDNPDQTDTGQKGYGDACAIFDFSVGVPRQDSDGDTVPDSSDNCPYTPNPLQEDAGIILSGDITVPDGIGDACITETADTGAVTVTTLAPVTATLPLRRVRWLTVDINDQSSLSCSWMGGGSCTVETGPFVLCLDEAGGFGCD